jgi:hypothetical protein
LGQRERRGPAKDVVSFQDTVYDRIFSVAEGLLSLANTGAAEGAFKEFQGKVEGLVATLDKVSEDVVYLETMLESVISEEDKAQSGVGSYIDDLNTRVLDARRLLSEDISYGPEEADIDYEVSQGSAELLELAEEIKQIGLSTQQGTTSPIDLGDWLY